jgi:hypothetical protein
MASKRTNWGNGFADAVAIRGTDPDGNAPPATWYLVLIDNSYDWANTNPDHDNISEITGRLDPANYSGNSISRAGASWTVTVDDANNKSIVAPASNPVITASANLSNIQGFAICTANSIVTAKVYAIHEFTATFNLSSGNNVTLTGVGLEAIP